MSTRYRQSDYQRDLPKLDLGNGKLVLDNPTDCYHAMLTDTRISMWRSFITEEYIPPTRDLLLFYPCSAVKPYSSSRSYKALHTTLQELGDLAERVHVVTVCEPYGPVPEEFASLEMFQYDCPGLFGWWCQDRRKRYSRSDLDMCVNLLGRAVGDYLLNALKRRRYQKVIGFVRTFSSRLEQRIDHTHRRILEEASLHANAPIEILPTRELVERIVETHKPQAWDRWGVAHPVAQAFLLTRLRAVLGQRTS